MSSKYDQIEAIGEDINKCDNIYEDHMHIKLDLHAKSFIPKNFSSESQGQMVPLLSPKGSSDENLEHYSSEEEKNLSTMNNSVLSGSSSVKTQQNGLLIKYKTERCKYWDISGYCKYKENCAFAHGNSEVRQKVVPTPNYKTKKCKQFFENGFCPYGPRCQFLHKDLSDSDKFSYKKVIDMMISSNSAAEINALKRHRLRVFENITKSKAELNREGILTDLIKLKMGHMF